MKKLSKNAEFHADFKSVEKVLQKSTKKSYQQNKFDEHEKKWEKVHISVRFLLITFLVHFLNTFSTDLKSA
jgi:hypothetical protein